MCRSITRIACLAALVLACAGTQQGPRLANAEGPVRSLAAAIPSEARFAFIAERPWSHTASHRDVAERLGFTKEYGTFILGLTAFLGFDATEPAEVESHGFDRSSGLAVFLLPEETAPVIAVGISDRERAEKSLRSLLERSRTARGLGRFAFSYVAAPSGTLLTVASRDDERLGYLSKDGYLFVRTIAKTDPMRTLQRIAALRPDGMLDSAPGYRAHARRIADADLLLYVSPGEMARNLPAARLSGASAVSLSMLADRIQLRFSADRLSGSEPASTPQARADLAAGLPAGALLWMEMRTSPPLFWREMAHGESWSRIAECLKELFGPDPEGEVSHSFTGNFAAALYRGERAPVFVFAAELAAGRSGAVEAMFDRGTEALAKRTPAAVQRRTVGGAPLWRVANGAMVAAIHQDRLLIALSTPDPSAPETGPAVWAREATSRETGPLAQILRAEPGRRSLRDELEKTTALSRESGSGAVLDLPGLLDAIRLLNEGPSDELEAIESFFRQHEGMPSQAMFEWRMSAQGMEGQLQLPLAPRSATQLAQPDPVRKLLQDARRQAALHPQDSRRHADLANALLKAGAGEAARDEARRAVVLAPEVSGPHWILGWVLEHDQFGRRWHPGLDYPGALEALRNAVKIDPSHLGAGVDLALLLERKPSESNLAQAIAQIQNIRAGSRGPRDERLLQAEFFAGTWDELLADAQSMPQSEARDAFALAARAAAESAAAALKAADIIPADQRRKTLARAANLLENARFYPAAADLFREAALGASDSQALSSHARYVARLARTDPGKAAPADPVWVVREAGVEAYDPDVPAEQLARFVSAAAPIDPARVRLSLSWLPPGRRFAMLVQGIGAASVRDSIWSEEARADGDADSAWRVEMSGENYRKPDVWWLVQEEGAAKVLCRATCPGILAAHALALIESGHSPAGVGRVLRWARESVTPEMLEHYGTWSFFESLMNGHAGLRVTAAVGAASAGKRAAMAVPILASAAEATPDPAQRARLRLALARAHLSANNPQAALSVAQELDAVANPEARAVRAHALRELKRQHEAQAVIDEWLRATPDDPLALWTALLHGRAVQDLARTEAAARKLIALGKWGQNAQNALAWAKFCHGKADDDAIALARKASEAGAAAPLNTLAALYAETGKFDEARETLFKSLDARGDGQPSVADRYVLGRIFEGYGLEDVAATEYRRAIAEAERGPHDDAACVIRAAETRLASLLRAAR